MAQSRNKGNIASNSRTTYNGPSEVWPTLSSKSELAQAIIWEAYHRGEQKGNRKIEGFNPQAIMKKYGCSYSSAENQFKNLLGNWFAVKTHKSKKKGSNWKLLESRFNQLKGAIDKWWQRHVQKIVSGGFRPDLVPFACYIFHALKKEERSVTDLEKILEEKSAFSGDLKERIEFTLRLFAPYIKARFRGSKGRTFYYSPKDKAKLPFLTSTDGRWRVKENKPFIIDLQAEKPRTRPLLNADIVIFPPFLKDKEASIFIPPAILDHRSVFFERVGVKTPPCCEECKNEKLGTTKEPFSFGFEGESDRSYLVEKDYTQYDVCTNDIIRLIQPLHPLRGRSVVAFHRCPKNKGYLPLDKGMFIPTSLPQP